MTLCAGVCGWHEADIRHNVYNGSLRGVLYTVTGTAGRDSSRCRYHEN